MHKAQRDTDAKGIDDGRGRRWAGTTESAIEQKNLDFYVKVFLASGVPSWIAT